MHRNDTSITLLAEEFKKDEKWEILPPPSKETRLKNIKTNFIVNKNGSTKKNT